MLSKEVFVKTINEVQKVWDYSNSLDKFFRENDVEGYIIQPDCTDTVVNLLHEIFEEKDKLEWISYYCWELDFGRKWVKGTVIDNGKDIILNNAGALYDFLISNGGN